MNDQYINGFKDGFISGLDLKENLRCNLFGMDVKKVLKILSEYIKKEQESEVPNIPEGFTFEWSKRKEIDEFFAKIAQQGFKVVKDE